MKKIVLVICIVLLVCMISCNGGNPDGGTVNTVQSFDTGNEPNEKLPSPGSIPIPIPSDWDLASELFNPVIHGEQKAAWEALHISSYQFRTGTHTYIVYPNGTVWSTGNGSEPVWHTTPIDNIFDTIPDWVADYAQYGGKCYIRYNSTYHYPEVFYVINNTWGSDAPSSIFYVQKFEVTEPFDPLVIQFGEAEPFDAVIHADQKAAWEALHISSYQYRGGYNELGYPPRARTVTVTPDGVVGADGEPAGYYGASFDRIFDDISYIVDAFSQYRGDHFIRYNATYHYPELYYIINNTWNSSEPSHAMLYVFNFEVLEQ